MSIGSVMSKHPTRGLSINSAEGGASNRAARSDWVCDNFRSGEPELVNAAIRYLTDPSAFRENCPRALGLYVESDLDKWERRTSGALLVGSNRPLLTRFIKGDDLKNQAAGTVRTVNAHFTYLNLSQLMAICQRSMSPDYYKSSIAELRDLGSCLEEAMAEKLMTALLQLSDCYVNTDEEGLQSEVFSLQERKFLGRRLLFLIGALALPNIKGSSLENHFFPFEAVDSCWYVYCEATATADAWGFYLKYPELRISLNAPVEQGLKILSLIENRQIGIVTAGSILTWHILSTTISSDDFNIQELVQHGKSMKSSGSTIRGSTNKKKMGDRKLSTETIEVRDEELETEAPETPSKVGDGNEEIEEWGGPVEFDEAVPTYYDLQQETYFYYGNVLYYDPDFETYYYYDWDEENYMYIDEETLVMINDNTIPCWNAEDGQYYDASMWAEATAEEDDIVHEAVDAAPEDGEVELSSEIDPTSMDVVVEGIKGEETAAETEKDETAVGDETAAETEKDETAVGDETAAETEKDETATEGLGESKDDVNLMSQQANINETQKSSGGAAETPAKEPAEVTDESKETPAKETAELTDESKETPATITTAKDETSSELSETLIDQRETGAEKGDMQRKPSDKEEETAKVVETAKKTEGLQVDGSEEGESLYSDEETSSSDSVALLPKVELPRASKVSAPRLAPERFNNSIDQFKSSESLLINRAMKVLVRTFDDRLDLLDVWAVRNNGTIRVGRNKRLIEGLIKGSMELKSMSTTECADVASNLALLNLAQLLYIRINAQNSAWDKSPVNTQKTFAMKTDSLIAEKLVATILEAGASIKQEDEEALQRANMLLTELQPLECRHAGSQAVFILGALPELRTAQIKILGIDGMKASWWFLSISPFGGAVMPKDRVMKKPLGIFMRVQLVEDHILLQGQFDPPTNECAHVFKLVAGRGNAGFVTWDVLQITIAGNSPTAR